MEDYKYKYLKQDGFNEWFSTAVILLLISAIIWDWINLI